MRDLGDHSKLTRPRPRSPGYVFGVLSLLMIVLVTAVALTRRHPPPPTIAEFAPQAVQQIREGPTDQSFSEGGFGDGGDGGSGSDVATTDADAILVPRVRKCVGDPPRQIEDPQSPPCVPYWTGDNGGATGKGITATEIRVAAPFDLHGGGGRNGALSPTYQAVEKFFNRRFEFYGRKLRIISWGGPSGGGGSDAARMSADAAGIDEELDAFASLPYPEQGGSEYLYYDELARRGIVSVSGGWTSMNVPESHFLENSPYQWNVLPAIDLIGANLGEWICKQLAGGVAEHAGPEWASSQRRFGLLISKANDGGEPDLTRLRSTLDGCGVEIAAEHELPQGGFFAPDSQNAMVKFRQARVTSVIGFVHSVWFQTTILPAASSQGYQPEWIIPTYLKATSDNNNFASPREQMRHVFGLESRNKNQLIEDRPTTWAIKEGNADLTMSQDDEAWLYWPLLVLASGIQMAGPRLTPHTFQAGLERTKFPNPGAGKAPYFQAHVQFGPNDRDFFDGAARIWWSSTQISKENGDPGAFCYVNGGERHDIGRWPQERPALFRGDCY